MKDVRASLAALLPRLEPVDDDRARTAHAVLSKRTWDLYAAALGRHLPELTAWSFGRAMLASGTAGGAGRDG